MTDKTLKYKNYFGSIECDLEEGVLHGKILHVRDLITYESETLQGLQGEFTAAVDDYVETCSILGKTPDKPYTGSFNTRIGPDLHYAAAVYAANNGKSLNQVMLEAVRAKLNPKVDEVHVNHDHNIHHEHIVKLEDAAGISAVNKLDFDISEEQWPFSENLKTSFQEHH